MIYLKNNKTSTKFRSFSRTSVKKINCRFKKNLAILVVANGCKLFCLISLLILNGNLQRSHPIYNFSHNERLVINQVASPDYNLSLTFLILFITIL